MSNDPDLARIASRLAEHAKYLVDAGAGTLKNLAKQAGLGQNSTIFTKIAKPPYSKKTLLRVTKALIEISQQANNQSPDWVKKIDRAELLHLLEELEGSRDIDVYWLSRINAFTPQLSEDVGLKLLRDLTQAEPETAYNTILVGNFILRQTRKLVYATTFIKESGAWKLKVKAAMKDLIKKGKTADISKLAQDYALEVNPDFKGDTNAKSWFDRQLQLFEFIFPGRSRLSRLSWPAPYDKDWAFESTVRFSSRYMSDDGYLDFDKAINFYLGDSSDDRGEDGSTGSPRHKYYRPGAYLFDVTKKSAETLNRIKFEYTDLPEHEYLSPRLRPIAGRLISGLLSNGRLLYNSALAVCDVAPTRVNKLIRISSDGFVKALVSTAAVGLDAYNDSGVWEFDGISPVSEDGRWMLLRSNHVSKVIKVSVLCCTSDHRLALSYHLPETIFDTPNWAPTCVSFAEPVDFESKCGLMVDAVEKAARRIVADRISSEEGEKMTVSVVGFALDAASGLMPNYFCLAVLTKSEEELRLKFQKGKPMRFHPIVEDNPAVSLAEAYSSGRFAEADLLRACLFAAWRWFVWTAAQRKITDKDSASLLEPVGIDVIGVKQEEDLVNNGDVTVQKSDGLLSR